ncbi:MAG: phosphoribosylglycinamide formyltransferase [Bacteroidota bacterium]|nr:phosphoribosylglycinamide formyltransferase [Bacteroidota bacterium]
MPIIRIALLASGSGTNAENIVRYFSGRKDVLISLIISNKPDAFVLKRAEKLGVPSVVMAKETLEHPDSLLAVLTEHKIDFIVLAGFLLKVPAEVIRSFPGRILNIHPALLPKHGGKGMYGNRVHEAVIHAGEKESGITIHLINEQYDEGAMVYQATCPVLPDDTPDVLAARIHLLEYEHYPRVIDETLKKVF